MKVEFVVPLVDAPNYKIEGELTPDEANVLLNYAFVQLLRAGMVAASLAPQVTEMVERFEKDDPGGTETKH